MNFTAGLQLDTGATMRFTLPDSAGVDYVPLLIGGLFNLSNSNLIFVIGAFNRRRVVPTGEVVVAQASVVSGTPAAITVVSSDPCTSGSAMHSLSPGSLSVTISATSTCEGGSGTLSTDAIYGIALGAAAGAVILTLLIIFLVRKLNRRRDARANQEIRQMEMGRLEVDAAEGRKVSPNRFYRNV